MGNWEQSTRKICGLIMHKKLKASEKFDEQIILSTKYASTQTNKKMIHKQRNLPYNKFQVTTVIPKQEQENKNQT